MKSAGSRVLLLILILVLGAAFVYWMNHMFNTSAIMRDMFCGAGNPGVLGEVAPGSGDAELKVRPYLDADFLGDHRDAVSRFRRRFRRDRRDQKRRGLRETQTQEA